MPGASHARAAAAAAVVGAVPCVCVCTRVYKCASTGQPGKALRNLKAGAAKAPCTHVQCGEKARYGA
eukprot:828035-Pelagomonas_calceolata.AAC.2